MGLILNPEPEILMEADAATYYEGETIKAGTAASRVAKTTAKGDTCIGIVCVSRFDPKTGVAEAHVAGDKIRVYKLDSKATVQVKCVTAQAFTPGAAVYLDDAVDGQATAAAATSRPIGHIPRNIAAFTTASAGELIPVYLDVEEGASTV